VAFVRGLQRSPPEEYPRGEVTIELRPTAPIAADALLPGDPGRALALAQELLVAPRMSNHHRGLWGYFGETAGGRALTIQATGIGGPSAAVVLRELAARGLRRAVRVGTCAARRPGLAPGALVVVEAALASDGTSRALGASGTLAPDGELTRALVDAAGGRATAATVTTVDLWEQQAAGSAAVEMAAAPLFALGPGLGVAAACLLVVGEGAGGERLDDDALGSGSAATGEIAIAALAGPKTQPSLEPSETSSAA
jgi:uridine phosphorylase